MEDTYSIQKKMINCWSFKTFVYRADYGASWTLSFNYYDSEHHWLNFSVISPGGFLLQLSPNLHSDSDSVLWNL